MYYVDSLEESKAVLYNTETGSHIEIDRILLPKSIGVHFPLNLHIKENITDIPKQQYSSVLIPYANSIERYAAFALGIITDIDARLLPSDIHLPCILHITVDIPALKLLCVSSIEKGLLILAQEKVIDYMEGSVAAIAFQGETIPLDRRLLPECAIESNIINIDVLKADSPPEGRRILVMRHDTETHCQISKFTTTIIDQRLLPKDVRAGVTLCISVDHEKTDLRKQAAAALLKSLEKKGRKNEC